MGCKSKVKGYVQFYQDKDGKNHAKNRKKSGGFGKKYTLPAPPKK